MASPLIDKLIPFRKLPIRVEDTVKIEAPADIVWAVTENIEQWSEWTPTVTEARRLDDRPFGPGSVVRLKQPGQPESDWTVIQYVGEESFSWKTERRGLRMTATHQLTRKNSETWNTLTAEASGILAIVLWPLLRFAIRHALRQENRGLKKRCETLHAADGKVKQV